MEIGRVSKGKESKGKHKGKRTKMQLFASNAEANDTRFRSVFHRVFRRRAKARAKTAKAKAKAKKGSPRVRTAFK